MSADPRIPRPAMLRRWARAVGAGAPAAAWDEAELSLRVVDEDEGATLNETYRGRSGATNVLSFPFAEPARTRPPLIGDVVICAPVVTREADAQGKSSDAHFAHMVVHGVLHLMGYRHDDATDAARMEDLERRVLAGLGFDDPYAGEQRDGPA